MARQKDISQITYKECLAEIEKVKQRIEEAPKGYISKKTIKGRLYCYLQHRDGDKIKSQYIKDDEVKALSKKIDQRKADETYLKDLLLAEKKLAKAEAKLLKEKNQEKAALKKAAQKEKDTLKRAAQREKAALKKAAEKEKAAQKKAAEKEKAAQKKAAQKEKAAQKAAAQKAAKPSTRTTQKVAKPAVKKVPKNFDVPEAIIKPIPQIKQKIDPELGRPRTKSAEEVLKEIEMMIEDEPIIIPDKPKAVKKIPKNFDMPMRPKF